MQLKKKNSHPRDSFIEFEEDNHLYSNGKNPFTSVTTLISKYYPEFDADKVIAKMMNSPYWPQNKYHGKTSEEIKLEWDKKRDHSSKLGTLLHKNIEDYYNGEKVANFSPEWFYFLEWDKANVHLTPFRSEWVIYDEELMVAGTIDMIFKHGDDYIMVDWKRSAKINKQDRYNFFNHPLAHLPGNNYFKYALQQNFYKFILEKYYGIKIKAMFLLQLHPKVGKYELISCEDLQEEVKIIVEDLLN